MAYIRRKNNKKPKVSFYILVAAIAVAVFLIVFFVTYSPTMVLQEGVVTFETNQPVIIARDEDIISKETYGKVTYLASEGEYVAAGTDVAEIFKAGYNEQIMSELLEIQTKIGQYQETVLLGDVLDQNLITLNTSIEQKSKEISDSISGNSDGDLIQLEKELKRLLEDKKNYLKDAVKADSQLEEYYAKEEELQERVESWRETVQTEKSGVVSFYFDGCENLISEDNLGSLTIKEINEIMNGTSIEQLSNTNMERPLFRIVNSYKWYVIVVSSSAIKEFKQGSDFNIAFDEYLNKEFVGCVTGIREEDSGFVYVFEINDDIGPLISTRRTSADIYRSYTGIKVPSSSIKTQNGINGVNVKNGDEIVFIPVNIIIEENDECIVEAADDNRPLEYGMEIIL